MGNKRKSGPRTAPRRAGLRSTQQAFQWIVQKRASVDMGDGEEETLSPQAKRTRLSTYDESNPEELQNDANSTLGVGGPDVDKSRMEDYVEYHAAEECRWSHASFEEWRGGTKEVVDDFTSYADGHHAGHHRSCDLRHELLLRIHLAER